METPSAAFQVLTAMITPAVLISASGTLVFSTSSRLSRVVDRVRSLAEELRQMAELAPRDPEIARRRRGLYVEQLVQLSKRVRLLRSALTSLYLAIGLFVTTSIAVGLVALMSWSYGWVPVVLGLLGSCVLLFGSVLLIHEARLAVLSSLQEMAFVTEEMARLEVD